MPDPLVIVRPEARVALQLRLDQAVAQDARLAPAAEAILFPVRTLEALAELAVPALGDDPAAAERLRLLVAAAGLPFEVDQGAAGSTADGLSSKPPPAVWQPGALVDLGAAVILGLASLRAGAPLQLGSGLLGTLVGLILATGPAEAVLRWDGMGGTDRGFDAFLASFAAARENRSGLYQVFARMLLVDPAERARWACVLSVFGRRGLGVDARHRVGWVPAHADGIAAVAVDGATCTITGELPERGKGQAQLQVVAAGRRIAPAAVAATVVSWSATRIVATVPGGLAGGWLGFTSPRLVAEANALRDRLRKRWGTAQAPCLPDGVPAALIPRIPDLPTPPRVAMPRAARLATAALAGPAGPVPPGSALAVAVTTAPADAPAWVGLAGDPAPRVRVVAGAATLAVPPALVRDGAVLAVELADAADAPASDRRELPALRVAGALRVVVVRPALVDQSGGGEAVPADAADTALAALARRAGLVVWRQVLPALADDLAALYGPVAGADDQRVDRLLAALARAAACTPGAEDALWLAVLPGKEPWYRLATAAAARTVAVATPAGVAELAEGLAAAEAATVTTVMRLAGTVTRLGGIAWSPPRIEERPHRTWSGTATGLVAAVRDGGGRVLAETPLDAVSGGAADAFACLVPLPPEAESIEVRRSGRFHGEVVALLQRPAAGPTIAAAIAGDGGLAWTYRHPRGLPGHLALEARLQPAQALGIAGAAATAAAPEAWTPLEDWCGCGCDERSEPAWGRYDLGPEPGLRLVADDGWNAAFAAIAGSPPAVPAPTARIRALPDGRLWADGAATPAWTVAGRAVTATRLLRPQVAGTVALALAPGTGIADTLTLEAAHGLDPR